MVFKWLFGSIGGRGFRPSSDDFPSLHTDAIGRELRLERRGAQDAKAGFPSPDSESLSQTERDVVERVNELRKKGLEYYGDQITVYKKRIRGAFTERKNVKTEADQFKAKLEIEIRKCTNHLQNSRQSVSGSYQKLTAYMDRHGVVGPPNKEKNLIFMVGVLLILFVLEASLSGILFAEKSEMGLVGGMGIAIVISGVNVMACLLCGFGSRYVNLNSYFCKILGVMSFLIFCGILVCLNLTVAHFRDALESSVWDDAAFHAIENLRENIFGIDSFNSWVVAAFGGIVSIIAFIEGLIWSDRHPGYNSVFSAKEDAVERYAREFDQAQNQLDEIYEKAKDELKLHAQRMEADVKSAMDAIGSQSALERNLKIFLQNCDLAVNQLHARYREANAKSRSKPRPPYFDKDYYFPPCSFPEDLLKTDIENAAAEINKVNEIVEHSVNNLLDAKKKAISAFLTVQQLEETELQRNNDDPNTQGKQ